MFAAPTLTQQNLSRPRAASAWLWLFGAVLIACSLIFLGMSRHWPMVGDAALLRYTVFLIRQGWAPYRDFVDINMPGAYGVTALGMHLADASDLSWRIFDLGLIALTGASYFVIARPYSRFAALFATAMLLLVHGQDGVQQAGQRDLVIAALLTMAVALLLEAVRRDRWLYLLPFGVAVGLSATIKPTSAPLGLVLLGMAAGHRAGWWGAAGEPERAQQKQAQQKHGWLAWISMGIAAMAVPPAYMLVWLARKGALGAWVTTERMLLPYYASQERRPLSFTLMHSVAPLVSLVLLWLLCAALRGPAWPRFERRLVMVAVLVNLLSFLAQGKALPYQRYPMLAFLLLLIALDLTTAWEARGPSAHHAARYAALAGLGCACLVLAPLALVRVHRFVAEPQEFDAMLAGDLRHVDDGNLSGRVQCLDSIQECLPTLYNLRLLPATGILSDLTLFDDAKQPAVAATRRIFLEAVERRPPAAFVVVSGFSLDGTSGYRKLDRWPAFAEWLRAHYTMTEERTPIHRVQWWGRAQPPAGYRLYVWKPRSAGTEMPLR